MKEAFPPNFCAVSVINSFANSKCLIKLLELVEDYKIYVSDTCEVAYRKVKAFYPKAFVKIENKRFRILDADFELNALTSAQGEIVNDNMHISLRSGTLTPKVVQMEGRNSCSVAVISHRNQRSFSFKSK